MALKRVWTAGSCRLEPSALLSHPHPLPQWRERADAQQAKRQRAAACLRRMLHWRVAAAWAAWRRRVTAWGQKRARLQRCVAMLRCGQAAVGRLLWGRWAWAAAAAALVHLSLPPARVLIQSPALTLP